MRQEGGLSSMAEGAKKRITALAALPDSKIDTSDIPEWTGADLARPVFLYVER